MISFLAGGAIFFPYLAWPVWCFSVCVCVYVVCRSVCRHRLGWTVSQYIFLFLQKVCHCVSASLAALVSSQSRCTADYLTNIKMQRSGAALWAFFFSFFAITVAFGGDENPLLLKWWDASSCNMQQSRIFNSHCDYGGRIDSRTQWESITHCMCRWFMVASSWEWTPTSVCHRKEQSGRKRHLCPAVCRVAPRGKTLWNNFSVAETNRQPQLRSAPERV